MIRELISHFIPFVFFVYALTRLSRDKQEAIFYLLVAIFMKMY